MNMDNVFNVSYFIQVGLSVFSLFAVPISAFEPFWFGILWGIFWSVLLAHLISLLFVEEKHCTCPHKCPDCGSELIPVYENTQNKP